MDEFSSSSCSAHEKVSEMAFQSNNSYVDVMKCIKTTAEITYSFG